MDTPHIAHGGGTKHNHTNAVLAAYWYLIIAERMGDRSDGGFHRRSQILSTGTQISSPLAAQGQLYVLV
jgi:hypothetical protein